MLYHKGRFMLPHPHEPTSSAAGRGLVAVERVGSRTAVAHAFATSPLRLLLPNNHGDAAWVFLSTFGGGLVDGDCVDLVVRVGRRAAVLLGTQASTKVYRSPRGCRQRVAVEAANASTVVLVPDPVVCFAGARYQQETTVFLAPDASLLVLEGYTAGRRARGERWQFDRYASRTTITREGGAPIVDATRLDARHGPIADRMGRFDVMLTLLAVGPRFEALRERLLEPRAMPAPVDRTVVAASRIGPDAAIVRVGSERFELASLALRSSFTELKAVLGDDPFARKW